MERPDIDGHPTIGGGAVIRLSKQGLEDVKKGMVRLGQTTVALTPIMRELVEILAGMGEPVEPEVTAHLGMTPDGGYKAPEEITKHIDPSVPPSSPDFPDQESFPIRKRGSEWKADAAGEFGPRYS